MKKKMIGLLTALLTASLLTGCGSADAASDGMYFSKTQSNYAYPEAAYEKEMSEDAYVTGSTYNKENGESANTLSESAATDRKLIKNVSLEVETKEYDSLMQTVEQQVNAFNGYIENMDSYNDSNYSGRKNTRYANLTIRIPQEKLSQFLGSVSEVCNVIRRNDSVNDVTLTYVDTASRRDSLKVQQERLLAMLEQCVTLEDMLTLEERLTDVRYQLESLERQLRSMDNKVSYSTVSLSITEVQELTPVIVEEPTNWERIRDGFNKTLDDVINGFVEFGIWFIVKLPVLIVWVVFILIAFLILKVIRKKRKLRKEKKQAVKEPIPLKEDKETIEKK